jgi:hypothetical protein
VGEGFDDKAIAFKPFDRSASGPAVAPVNPHGTAPAHADAAGMTDIYLPIFPKQVKKFPRPPLYRRPKASRRFCERHGILFFRALKGCGMHYQSVCS